MTTTKYNKNTAKERTMGLGNKTLTPSGDNQHPKTTNEEECSSPSLLPDCTLHPLIVETKTPITEKMEQNEDNIPYKEQIAQEQEYISGLDPVGTKILHDANLMSSLCSCSYALTNYYPPRMVGIACLLLTARHHCYHLHGNNRSKMSEVSQSISNEMVQELMQELFQCHEDDSSPSKGNAAAAMLLQRLKLLPCHYSTCHTNEENNHDDGSRNDELVIISNVMSEIEQFLCSNLPSPKRLPSSSEPSPKLTVSPPIHSSLSITASITASKKSPILSPLPNQQKKHRSEQPTALTSSPPKSTPTDYNQRKTPTPPTSSSSNRPPTVTSSPSCHSLVYTTSTPKSRQPLTCRENLSDDPDTTTSTTSTSRRRLHANTEHECEGETVLPGLQDKENNDSAIGMTLDTTGASSRGSNYCGSGSNTNSSPSSSGSSKNASPDSGTSTVSHTKISVPEMDSIKRDFDLKEIGDALSDCPHPVSLQKQDEKS